MFPDEVSQFATPGEEWVYRFLRRAARPDSEFIGWYAPDVEEREPDFLLYYRKIGLLVIEVKDWVARQIAGADPHAFELRMADSTERRMNPLRQADQYSNAVRERLKRDDLLSHTGGPYEGKAKLPVSVAVAFPNISREEFRRIDLGKVIPEQKVFLQDDLEQKAYASDATGGRLREALEQRFPPLFRFQLDARELDRLRQVLFPQIELRLPEHSVRQDYIDRENALHALDQRQQRIAKNVGAGHRIFTGPSGSGKTLILVHHAALLQRYDPRIRRMLFLCYNLTLVNHLRDLLSRQRVAMGEEGVQVKPFFELCEEIVGEEIEHEQETDEYYELVAEEALERIEAGSVRRYHAILVDEGQDFSTPMMKVVRKLLDPATNNLLIALDEGQDIYRRSRNWKQAGIDAKGRTQRICNVYRSSRQLVAFSRALLERARGAEDAPRAALSPSQLPLPAVELMDGPVPRLELVNDLVGAADRAAAWVRELADRGLPLSQFAVLYAHSRSYLNDTLLYPEEIRRALLAKGLDCSWASENPAAKTRFRLGAEAVTISTVHSAKGLDWECVVLLGLDDLTPEGQGEGEGEGQGNPIDGQLLAYVGIGRARSRLLVPYTRRNALIEQLEGALEQAKAGGRAK